MSAVCVTQKGFDYSVITLRIDRLQAYKNSLDKISLQLRIQAMILQVVFDILQW